MTYLSSDTKLPGLRDFRVGEGSPCCSAWSPIPWAIERNRFHSVGVSVVDKDTAWSPWKAYIGKPMQRPRVLEQVHVICWRHCQWEGYAWLLGPGHGGDCTWPWNSCIYGTKGSPYECYVAGPPSIQHMTEALYPGPNPSMPRGHSHMTGGPVPQTSHLCCTSVFLSSPLPQCTMGWSLKPGQKTPTWLWSSWLDKLVQP